MVEHMSCLEAINSSETFKMHMEKYKQDNGKEYWRVIGSDVPKFYVTRAYIHIDNLFNGDKVLGETTNLFLEENWKELVKDFEPLFSGALDSLLKQVLGPIFDKVPYDEIFPETV
uniref:Uncharacterized protein n=1 Tax=Timema cristinae TaxID=61476 RepID=A0A7R9DDC1_TIMCR|nr:unnamed protein product [Timema cristinae]